MTLNAQPIALGQDHGSVNVIGGFCETVAVSPCVTTNLLVFLGRLQGLLAEIRAIFQ
jgi:hypothetical protein